MNNADFDSSRILEEHPEFQEAIAATKLP